MELIDDIYWILFKYIYHIQYINQINRLFYLIQQDIITKIKKIQKCYRKYIFRLYLKSKIVYRKKDIDSIDLIWDSTFSVFILDIYKTQLLYTEINNIFLPPKTTPTQI